MRTVAAIALLLFSVAPLEGQMVFRTGPGGPGGTEMLDRAPAAYGVPSWRVGEWARYSVQAIMGPGTQMQSFRTVSVVGQDAEKFWVEVSDETVSPMTMRSPVRKMLVPFGPAVESAMSEMLVMRGDSSVVRQTMVRPARADAAAGPAFPSGWEKVGEESLQVRAGTFKTVHYKKGAQDLWVSATAGPIGVVRFKTEQNTVELVAHENTGAKSAINVGSAP